jgi:NAD-dependent dihydropyrimidine dehydrogenase PreA subunit
MFELRYLKNVTTLQLDEGKCIGCRMCAQVCPHGVFVMQGSKAQIVDKDACMECGACMKNCPVDAITVRTGVGCASGVIRGFLKGTDACCDCC